MMETPQTPQVRVPDDTELTHGSNATVTTNNDTEVVMGGTNDPATSRSETLPDTTLPDAQLEQGSPAPAKKNGGYNFLE